MACTETIIVRCPDCTSEDIQRNGKSSIHQQRYYCKRCKRSFQRHFQRKAWTPKVRKMVVAMTMRNSGIHDIEDVLNIHRDSVMAALKRAADAIPRESPSKVRVVYTAELDEFWSFVRSKEHQQWTWYVWDAKPKRVLAYCNGRRTDASSKALCKELFANYDIRRYNTDDGQSYRNVLPPDKHRVSKKGTQRIERQNLNFRTQLKRLNRRTLCFSKSEIMHDAVIQLYIYRINTRKQHFYDSTQRKIAFLMSVRLWYTLLHNHPKIIPHLFLQVVELLQ